MNLSACCFLTSGVSSIGSRPGVIVTADIGAIIEGGSSNIAVVVYVTAMVLVLLRVLLWLLLLLILGMELVALLVLV